MINACLVSKIAQLFPQMKCWKVRSVSVPLKKPTYMLPSHVHGWPMVIFSFYMPPESTLTKLHSTASYFCKKIMFFFWMCKYKSPSRKLFIQYLDQNLFSSKENSYKFYCQAKACPFSPYVLNNYLYFLQRSFHNLIH